MYDIVIRKTNNNERLEVENFLSTFNLVLDKDVEYTAIVRRENEIIGTCSYAGNVIKCFAVNKEIQREGIASKLITHITNKLFDKGIFEHFIFTDSVNIPFFEDFHFKEVYSVEGISLLEGGTANVKRYVEKMFINSGMSKNKKAAIVMNCNPFTLGHRYLIEKAARENAEVVIFVVEENASLFPFDVRLDLVKKGTEDLENVFVISGGAYIISSNTFPAYFLREESVRLSVYTKLDAGIFSSYIAPIFNIKKRYVGTEPYCNVTNQYNDALDNVLPKYGVELIKVERRGVENKAISASKVRMGIKNDDWDLVKSLVPETTYNFLMSEVASKIIDRIKGSESPH